MAVFKCKMCDGNLDITEGSNICTCSYCGTSQTVPVFDDDKKLTLFTKANELRKKCDYDKAANMYENIVTEFPLESEAYWGLCLCTYGIEYVDDPVTQKKIPTCHRTVVESIFDDENFVQANEYATPNARDIFYAEAKEIDRIQRSILEIVKNEEPYDIFICYKETDENGERTKDSVMGQDIYNALTREGYKVFFSRISLEDKIGQQYEPYIFAALTSAKVMLALGTHREHFNAVWVKNEWSRFLDMMRSDSSKTIIPCFADIDAYDMPREFKNIQAQDMGKVGFLQDLVFGIKKLIPKNKTQQQPASIIKNNVNVSALLERAFMFLSSGDFKTADQYCERVLDEEPKNGKAYLGKLLSECRCRREEELGEIYIDITESSNYRNAVQYGCDIKKYGTMTMYNRGCKLFENAETVKQLNAAKTLLEETHGYRDTDDKLDLVNIKLEKANALTNNCKEILRRYDESKTESGNSEALQRVINQREGIKINFPDFVDGEVPEPFNPKKLDAWFIPLSLGMIIAASEYMSSQIFYVVVFFISFIAAGIANFAVRKFFSAAALFGIFVGGSTFSAIMWFIFNIPVMAPVPVIALLVGIAVLGIMVLITVIYIRKKYRISRYYKSLDALEQFKTMMEEARNSEINEICNSCEGLNDTIISDCCKIAQENY